MFWNATRGKLPGLLEEILFRFTHIEGITLSAGEEVGEVAEGTSVMGVDRIGEVVTGLVKDRLLGCMGLVLQRVSGRERSQGWDEGQG